MSQSGYLKAVFKRSNINSISIYGICLFTHQGRTPHCWILSKLICDFSNRPRILQHYVVCTLTSRHHILSNMQDQLLQLLQIFQYLHHKIKFWLLITNNFVGDDVTLQYWSWLAYSSMGFDTSTLTQDCNNMVFFGIKTDYPIPMFQYGDLFTWAKYGYIILHPDLTCTVLSGLDKTNRKTVTTFLETDMRGIMNFYMQLHLQAEINL